MVKEGVTIEGLVTVQHQLNDLFQRGQDMSPLMAQIGAYGEELTRHRFESQKGPDGKAWEKSARAKAKGGQTLVDTARLRDSITWQSSASSAEWGTNVAYAAAHQFGIDKPQPVGAHTRLIRQAFGKPLAFPVYQSVAAFTRNPNLPARPYAGIDEGDETEIAALVHDFIAGALQ